MIPLMDQILTVELNNCVHRLNKNQKLNVIKDINDIESRDEPRPSGSKESKVKPLVPVFKVLPDTRPNTFKMPDNYICYNGKEAETDSDAIEYDIDCEDTAWLKLANDRRKRNKEKPICEDLFELAIDKLEKESHFQISIGASSTGSSQIPQVDNDAACCICNDADDSNVNQIIFCDMCNIPVHQECYGVPYIPEGQWLCRRCQLSPSVPVKCILCPYSYGAFKQTSDGSWAHVMCALWLNEVHFANTVFNEPIEGTENALRRRSKLRCLVCKQARVGACLQCSKKLCTRAFHVTCAYFAGLYMEVKQENADNDSGISRNVYCYKHTPEEVRPKMSEASWKRLINKKIKDARKQVLNYSREAPQISLPVIPQLKIEEIKGTLKLDKMDDICYYWALKRRSRFGVPLIRRLQVYQSQKSMKRRSNECSFNETINTDAEVKVEKVVSLGTQATNLSKSVVNTPVVNVGGGVMVGNRSDYGLTAEQIHVLRMRGNLERVRLLCELVKKREKYKREFVTTSEAIFEKCMKSMMGATLDSYLSKDHLNNSPFGSILDHLKNLALLKDTHIDVVENAATSFVKSPPTLKRMSLKSDKVEAIQSSSQPLPKNNSLKSRKRMRIDDFFAPATSSHGNNNVNETASTSTVLERLRTPNVSTSFTERRKAGRPRVNRGFKYLNISSASDTNGELTGYGTSSLDDDYTDADSPMISPPPTLRRIRNISRNTSAKRPRLSLTENKSTPSSIKKRRRNHKLCDDYDSIDPNTFVHNDIVWAELDNDRVVPAHIIDLRMRIHLENFPIDRALRLKPNSGDYTLIMMFDLAKTWKWVETNRLKPCDITASLNTFPPNFLHTLHLEGGALLRRARQFWNEMLCE